MSKRRILEHAYGEVWGVIESHIASGSYFGLDDDDVENGNVAAVTSEMRRIADQYAERADRMRKNRECKAT